MAKEMFSNRIDSDLTDALKLEALAERRSVANMLELILRERYSVLAGAGGTAGGNAGRVGGRAFEPVGSVDAGVLKTAPPVPASAVSPSDVAAKVPGVTVGVRAHMRGDRPNLECKNRVPAAQVCAACGRVV